MTAKKNRKMAIEQRHFGRRQFLMGTGGVFLTLPPLMSLMPRIAQAAVTGRTKRVILIPTLYGMSPKDFFPVTPAANLQTRVANSADLDVFTTPMTAFGNGLSVALGSAFDSPVLRSQMNLYEGLDVTHGGEVVSHTYGTLAGTAKSSTNDREPTYGESIDNTISKAPGFYATSPAIPVLRLTTNEEASYWSFDRASGKIQYKSFYQGDKAAFNKVFGNFAGGSGTPAPQTDEKALVADKVMADLTGLKSNKRLSSDDKILLDRYITGVTEMQKKIAANQAPPPAVCSKPNLTLQVTSEGSYYAFPGIYDGKGWGIKSCEAMMKNYNEIIVSAFLCDLTRVVVVGNAIFQDTPLSNYTAGAQFHSHDDGSGGPLTTAQKHAWYLNIIAHLAQRLAETPDPLSSTGSLLDNSIILFTNEHGGVASHTTLSIPTMTIGSCGGHFKTGLYVDCRQRPYTKDDYHESIGRPNKQLLISILQAAGVQPSQYLQNGDGKGFGDFETTIFGPNDPRSYKKFANSHNDPLPGIKA